MLKTTDDTGFVVHGNDARPGRIGFIRDAAQAARWAGYGYDARAALDRQRAFALSFHEIRDFRDAGRALRAFGGSERDYALAQGVPVDDPDFARIIGSLTAWHWEPPLVTA